MRVSSAEFIRNFGKITDRAMSEPVTITSKGRERLVVLSVAEYGRLKESARADDDSPDAMPASQRGH